MSFGVRFTLEAKSTLERSYGVLAEQDPQAAERALDVIDRAWAILEEFPFSCRRVEDPNPFLREIFLPFGSAGYVPLFEIEDRQTVTVLAGRHQREDDYR